MLKKADENFFRDKKGVSEMIAYVILISIAMGIAVTVFVWLRNFPPIINPAINCNEGTSISLDSYSCDPVGETITLKIKNTGRFNIDGVIVKVGDNLTREPVDMLRPDYGETLGFIGADTPGHFSFNLTASGNDNEQLAKFKRFNESGFYEPEGGIIRTVQIQPFIRDKRKIACIGAVIKEPLNNPECKIKS